jgi:glycosyltransferase involved in cell wall biosynthesis
MKPAATLIVDFQKYGYNLDLSMYPDGDVQIWDTPCENPPLIQPDDVVEEFLHKVDLVFTCETPYNWWLFKRAKESGVKCVLQPNYEFMEYLLHPELPQVDLLALPSEWHIHDIREKLAHLNIKYLPVPVDREKFPFTLRTELNTILHTAGNGAQPDRNGTLFLLEAMNLVKSPVKCTIRAIKPIMGGYRGSRNITMFVNDVQHPWQLYRDEDLFVFPRRFGGLCLPMQEAMSVGMPVITSDMSPQNTFMPAEFLPTSLDHILMTRAPIEVRNIEPQDLATRIDYLFDHPGTFREMSYVADHWAEQISWSRFRSIYLQAFEALWM